MEHFATHEDPMFEDFVGRLRNLMERQDIQTALRNEQRKSILQYMMLICILL